MTEMTDLRDRSPETDSSPPRARGLWYTLGAIFAAAGIVWGALTIVSLLAHEEHDEVHTYPAAGITELVASSDSGRIEIRGADSDTIVVHAHITEGLAAPHDRQQLDGARFTVHGSCSALSMNWCNVAYRIDVPSSVTVVRLSSDSGDIDLRLTAAPQTVEARSDSGSVHVGVPDASGGYRVEAHSDSGSVHVDIDTDPLAQRTIAARSDSGNVRIDHRVP